MNSTKQILVVDDEEIVRDLLSEVLSGFGFQVSTAEDGPSGLNMFRKPDCCYDLVIIDMSMPGMPGPEVCREIRKTNPTQKIVIATGSCSTDEEIAELKKSGINNILSKPFNLAILTRLLRDVLGEEAL
jgi:CheY-like chemotaxis protein